MSKSQLDLTTHLGFQLSLLKLASVPAPQAPAGAKSDIREAKQIEALVAVVSSSRG